MPHNYLQLQLQNMWCPCLVPSGTNTQVVSVCTCVCVHTYASCLKARAGETTPWIKVLVDKPDNLTSVPRTHTRKREDQFPQTVLHLCAQVCMPEHMNTCQHQCNKSQGWEQNLFNKALNGKIINFMATGTNSNVLWRGSKLHFRI